MLNRRNFLKLGAAAAAVTVLSRNATAIAAAPAKIPVTCRDAVLKQTGLGDCWSAFKELDSDGLEVNVATDMSLSGMFHPSIKYSLATADGVAAFKDACATNKVSLLTFMMSNRIDENPPEQVEWVRKVVSACGPLGVKTVRLDIVPRKMKSRDEFLPFAVKMCREFSTIAAGAGVRLGVENHGNTTNDPAFLEQLFDGVGAANLGLTLDTANFYWYGHPLTDLYGMFRKFAPRAFHTHAKSIRYPEEMKNVRRDMGWKYREYTRPVFEGDIDFEKVAQILREAGYSGDLCLENESLHHFAKEQHCEVLKKEIAHLRKFA